MKLAQDKLERSQIRNKKLHNQKAKKRVVQVRDKVLMLLTTVHNKLHMQWKSTFKFKECKGGNNYQNKINKKMKTFHINLFKQYVKRANVEMTATPGWQDFPGETRKETRVGTEIEVQGGRPQETSVVGIGKTVVGASADYV